MCALNINTQIRTCSVCECRSEYMCLCALTVHVRIYVCGYVRSIYSPSVYVYMCLHLCTHVLRMCAHALTVCTYALNV